MIQGDNATIRVDFGQSIGGINPDIYGHFAEHLGACVYGGLWVPENSGLPVVNGIREDVLALVKAMRPPNIRWPGGCFSEHYHWEDGIGPLRARPWRFDWVWKKPEPNAVGTHEFMDLRSLAETKPYLVANLRTGTAEEAAAWVHYCNDPPSTLLGHRRAGNGAPDSFQVKLWGVGNENWDADVHDLAGRTKEMAQAMKQADPSIAIVGIGAYKFGEEWNRTMLEIAGDYLDYLAPHHYDGWKERRVEEPADYYANLASTAAIGDTLRQTAALLDDVCADRPDLSIAMDEWGVWTQHTHGVHHNYDLSDGLVAAGVLNEMQRLCHRVRLACWAQMVNCLGMIQADAEQAWGTPVYHVFRLYATVCGEEAVPCRVECEELSQHRTVRPEIPPLPVLDVTATKTADGKRCVLSVVNRHRDEEITAALHLTGLPAQATVTAYQMTASGPFVMNTKEEPDAVKVTELRAGEVGKELAFPRQSLTLIAWQGD